MSLTKKQLSALLAVAIDAAHAAGQVIASYQGHQVAFQLKQSGTSVASKIVTEVDAEAELVKESIQSML